MHSSDARKLGNHPGKVLGQCAGLLTCANGGHGNPAWDSRSAPVDAHVHKSCTSRRASEQGSYHTDERLGGRCSGRQVKPLGVVDTHGLVC